MYKDTCATPANKKGKKIHDLICENKQNAYTSFSNWMWLSKCFVFLVEHVSLRALTFSAVSVKQIS